MYIPQDSPLVLHLPTSWRPAHSRSLPHMHVQRWDSNVQPHEQKTNRATIVPGDPALEYVNSMGGEPLPSKGVTGGGTPAQSRLDFQKI